MLVRLDLVTSWIAVIIIGREIVITAIRVAAFSLGIALAADQLGKLKMALQVIAITAVLLTIYSGWNYIRMNYKRLHLNK